jgi:hypothetical protein
MNDLEITAYSSEDYIEDADFPIFTNEVIVIRPEYFYENTDCQ